VVAAAPSGALPGGQRVRHHHHGRVATVLSIGKLGRGAEGYYLRAVATGVEDYYLGSGKAPGR
jgi:hypothetical protein